MSESNARNRGATTQAVAAQIRAERAASGLTQREIMDRSGLAKSTYLRMESGERVADVGQLAAFCAAVGVPMSVLLARAEERVEPARPGEPLSTYAARKVSPEAAAGIAAAEAAVDEQAKRAQPNG